MMSAGKGRTAAATMAAELGLTTKEIKQCRKAFAFYDKNGATISTSSLCNIQDDSPVWILTPFKPAVIQGLDP